MKTAVKVLIGGAVVYLIYEYLKSSGLWAQWFGGTVAPSLPAGPANVNITPPVNVSVTPPPATTTTTTPPANPPQYSTLEQNVLNAAISANAGSPSMQLNADQWNYYWSQVSGITQTADLFPAGNRGALMTFDEYVAARQAQNLPLSGISAFRAAAGSPYGWGPTPRRVIN